MITCYALKIEVERFWIFYWILELVTPALAGLWFLGIAPSGSQLNLCSESPQLTLESPCLSDSNFKHLRKITDFSFVEKSEDLTALNSFSLATITCCLLMAVYTLVPLSLTSLYYLTLCLPHSFSCLLGSFRHLGKHPVLTYKSVLQNSHAFHMMVAAIHKIIFRPKWSY